MNMRKKSKKLIHALGFTLVELMVVMGIIGILAAVVIVSLSSQGKNARGAKALSELSSAIPSLISCWSNDKSPQAPSGSGGNVICREGSTDLISYGNWPKVGANTALATYSYSGSLNNKFTWYVGLTSADDGNRVCCNSAMKSCKLIGSGDTCNATTPTN